MGSWQPVTEFVGGQWLYEGERLVIVEVYRSIKQDEGLILGKAILIKNMPPLDSPDAHQLYDTPEAFYLNLVKFIAQARHFLQKLAELLHSLIWILLLVLV